MTSTVDADVSTPSVAARSLRVPVRLYQAVRAGRPSPCRYWPTCSDYALEALAAHGAVRGVWLTTGRLLRCHPWASRSGVDLVPASRQRAMTSPGVAS
ncbi:MAG: membrane protein insertion efficiency factor YidD [Actinomycetota bacterium]|nr:membrane protein insertion efficiency factor YidD [Actinomycetota bacterium]